MKTTIVPAQVTTVEDKIAGNLNFTQLLLLVTPVFISGAIFAFFPPFLRLVGYKLIICSLLLLVCVSLAIRIKGKLLLTWISITARYNLRPRYYIYNKNDTHLRRASTAYKEVLEGSEEQAVKPTRRQPHVTIPVPLLVQLEQVIGDPRANFHLKTTKKGGLSVHIQEIK